jgi:hypothetical protein
MLCRKNINIIFFIKNHIYKIYNNEFLSLQYLKYISTEKHY